MNPHISLRQARYLLLWMVMGSGYIMLPASISRFTFQDAWLVPILFGVASLIPYFIIQAFIQTFPQKSLIEGFRQGLGKHAGWLAGLLFVVWLFVTMTLVTREIVGFVDTNILPQTPPYFTAALFIIPVAYMVHKGLEVTARMSEVFTPITLITTLILFLLALKWTDTSHLTPVLADGWSPVLRASLLPNTFSLQLLLGVTLTPSLSVRDMKKLILSTSALLVIFGLIIELTCTLVLGHTVTYSDYPILEVVRSIKYGEVFERLDSLYVTTVTVTVLIQLSAFYHVWCLELKHWLHVPHARSLVWSGAVAVWAASMFFYRDTKFLRQFQLFPSLGFQLITLMLLPLAAILMYRLRIHRKAVSTTEQ